MSFKSQKQLYFERLVKFIQLLQDFKIKISGDVLNEASCQFITSLIQKTQIVHIGSLDYEFSFRLIKQFKAELSQITHLQFDQINQPDQLFDFMSDEFDGF